MTRDSLYDITRGELVHETEDTLWFEPYEKKILKYRNIYRKDRNYVYQAIYRDSNGEILSNSKIKLIPSGERISFAPERQDRITYIYDNYKTDSVELSIHPLNIKFQYWVSNAEEGIIENVEKIWIHPMRQNQYKFTEVAPFPEVTFPLEIGKTWESTLNINNGYGDWAYTSGVSEYEVLEKDTISFNNENIEFWEIESKSNFPFGISELNYKFNVNYGFIEMNYKNYANETLDIKMIEVE